MKLHEVLATEPGGAQTVVEHACHSALGWYTRTTDAEGHKKVRFTDVFGRMVRVHEWWGTGGGEYWVTEYGYDVADNLVEVVDALDNVTEMGYDMLGRKRSMDDPDMGEWSYGYDAVGNIITQTDALNQEIEFSYDDLALRQA